MDAVNGFVGLVFVIALWLAGSALYFAPTITALIRKSRDIGVVIAVNVFLGWTLLGWVVALAFALRDNSARNQQPWPQMPPPYPYPPQQHWRPQQQWPAQPPLWHAQSQPAPYGYPTNPASQQTFPYPTPDDQVAEQRRRHTF